MVTNQMLTTLSGMRKPHGQDCAERGPLAYNSSLEGLG